MDLFPLLTLPPTDLQNLLNRFRLIELFQLSQCSRKASNTVKTYSSSFDKTPFSLFVTTGSRHDVSVNRSYDPSSLGFTFYEERDPELCYLQLPKTFNFDGQSIDFCKKGTGRPGLEAHYGCTTPYSSADFLKFAHYFKTLFSGSLYALSIAVDDNVLKETLKFEWLQKSQSLSIYGGGVTHKEMVQGLECFNGIKQLQLCCSPGKNFSYDKTISTEYASVSSATWIRRHNLLKFNCEYVEIGDSLLKNEDLNAFLSHWLQSGDKKLKSMRIYRERCYSKEERKNAYKFVQEEVLKGLPTLPGARKRPDAIRAFRNLRSETPFEAGMDLRRESDGVLATVVVRDEGYYGVSFTFVVWQEPDPNVVVVVP